AMVGRDIVAFDYTIYTAGGIANVNGNDLAITVLPNAPIDADTGLPVPTIAVATDGGVSIIKDNGSVVDITNTQDSSTFNFCQDVQFRSDGGIVWSADSTGNSAAPRFVHVLHTIPTSDFVHTVVANPTNTDEFYSRSTTSQGDLKFISASGLQALQESTGRTNVGTTDGLSSFAYNKADAAEGLTNHINSDYNTGWMNGDIKLATLSDTDTTNAGAEIVTNGDFATDSDWSKGAGWSISGGKATHDSTTGNRYLTQGGILTPGKQYVLIFTISSYTSGILRIYGATTQPIDITEGNTTYTIPFIAAAGGDVNFQSSVGAAFVGSIDNVSCKLAEQDRSYNGNGSQVFGTVTKTAVATGADLVGYSAWSTSNYLRHTSATNYGSPATISFMCWMKTTSTSNYQYMGSLVDGTSGSLVGLSINATGVTNVGRPYFYDSVNSSLPSSSGPRVDDGSWHCVVGVLDGTSKKLYIDGVLNTSSTGNTALAMTNVTNTNVGFYAATIGAGVVYPHLGSMALWRTSATAPSAEQIAKMYNDEKHLFQTNAKATLYGTSNAVTALAYDDDTELLHVGTSAGRSEFQGLNRVNNTTDAVGTAISASNGFIVED
ncbi:MAG: LamG-like jellyroll fold domain-containing protein, partial [Methylophagaceae bacterium]